MTSYQTPGTSSHPAATGARSVAHLVSWSPPCMSSVTKAIRVRTDANGFLTTRRLTESSSP
jgi:hypothetical protein